jgi:hypothetical protein
VIKFEMSDLDWGTVQNVEGDLFDCIPSRRRDTILCGRRRKYVLWKANRWVVSVFFVIPSSTQIEGRGGEIIDKEKIDGERLPNHHRPQLQQLQTLQHQVVLVQYEPTVSQQAGGVVDARVLPNP